MWPLAVAGLGLRYFRISVSEILGHPFRKPFGVALRSVEILGLYNNWCANLTLFARVEMEWAKTAMCLTVSVWVGSVGCGGVFCVALMRMVHRSVVGYLRPFNMILSLYIMLR